MEEVASSSLCQVGQAVVGVGGGDWGWVTAVGVGNGDWEWVAVVGWVMAIEGG